MKTPKPRSEQGGSPGSRGKSCAICRLPLAGARQKLSKSGKQCHESCLEQATQAGQRSAAPPAPGGRQPRKPREPRKPRQARESREPKKPQQRQQQASRQDGPGTPARFAGICPACQTRYPAKTLVTKVFAGWAHSDCVFPPETRSAPGTAGEFERNRRAVLSGETFRSQAPSTWRLGSSPSSGGRQR